MGGMDKRDIVTGEIGMESRNYCGIYAALLLLDFCRPIAGRPGAFLTAVGDRRLGRSMPWLGTAVCEERPCLGKKHWRL